MKHVIPVNISNDGNVFGGMFKKKNVTEAAIYCFAFFLFFKFVLFFVPLIPKLIIGCIIFIFPTLIILIGVGDQSMFEWLMLKVRYSRCEEIIPYLIQTENEEDIPKDFLGKRKWKKEKRKEAKEEKKKRKERLKKFNEKNSKKKQKQKKQKKPKKKNKEKKKRKKS